MNRYDDPPQGRPMSEAEQETAVFAEKAITQIRELRAEAQERRSMLEAQNDQWQAEYEHRLQTLQGVLDVVQGGLMQIEPTKAVPMDKADAQYRERHGEGFNRP